MWITQPLIHNQNPGNSENNIKNTPITANKGENQRGGHTNSQPIVDNSNVDNSQIVNNYAKNDKVANIVDSFPQNAKNDSDYQQQNSSMAKVAEELSAIKSDLSTMQKADKQREKSSFSAVSEQGGQISNSELWKSEKLSTMTVDKVYEKAGNPFKAGMMMKKIIAKGLSDDGEGMLFAMLVKLDLKCDGDICEIRVMQSLAELLRSNISKIEKHACGFKIKLIEIQAFTQNTQAEVDKIKKYFGEEYVKIVSSIATH